MEAFIETFLLVVGGMVVGTFCIMGVIIVGLAIMVGMSTIADKLYDRYCQKLQHIEKLRNLINEMKKQQPEKKTKKQ